MPEIGTSGSMSGDGKRAIGKASSTAPILDLYEDAAVKGIFRWCLAILIAPGYGIRRTVKPRSREAVRRFLRRRHKVQSRGTRSFPAQEIFGTYRVLRLRRVHLGPLPCNPLAGDPLPCDMR